MFFKPAFVDFRTVVSFTNGHHIWFSYATVRSFRTESFVQCAVCKARPLIDQVIHRVSSLCLDLAVPLSVPVPYVAREAFQRAH